MAIENAIHPIQVNILLFLLFHPQARFSQLNVLKASSDQFNFHLKMLMTSDLVEQTGKFYQLTPKGKEYANRFDTEHQVPERQAKVAIAVICVTHDGSGAKYLVQKRLKEPYFGFYGVVTGKVRWGETTKETAERELKEETGMTGKLKFAGIEHKMDYSENGELLEDKFFFIYKADNLKGKLIARFDGGKNYWFKPEEIAKLPEVFPDVYQILKMVTGENITFFENKFKVDKY